MSNEKVHHASIINKEVRAPLGATISNHEAASKDIIGKLDAAPPTKSTSESFGKHPNSEDLVELAQSTANFILKLAEICSKTAAASETTKDLLLNRVDAAQMESRDARKQFEDLQQEHEVLQNACAKYKEIAEQLKTELDSSVAQRDQAQKNESNLQADNHHLKNERDKTLRWIIPESLMEFIPGLEQELTDEGASEVRYQLHTLKFLSKIPDATASRIADSIGRLSSTLCAGLRSNPVLLQSIRSALNNALLGSISVMEIEPGIQIDETFMTGRGLQGCRTVSAIQSWAVIKDGVVIRKAEIVPAP